MSLLATLKQRAEESDPGHPGSLCRNCKKIMCPRCVVDPQLSRGRLCSDSGSLQSNLRSCHECGDDKKMLTASRRKVDKEEENNMEVVTYKHLCSACSHVVSEHRHEFWVEDGYQEYRMDCLLCGIGEDSISVMPRDPRKASVCGIITSFSFS